MFHLLPPVCRQQLLSYLKTYVKWIIVLPAALPLGAAAFLALLSALLGLPGGEAAAIILNGLGEAYLSLLTPLVQFGITAYLLVALFFVTGWESARPVSWRLPLLFLLSWYGRLRRMLPAVQGDGRRAAANHPFFNRNGYFSPGPTGLQAPALLTGVRPMLE